jgi:hypothetical protein
MADDKVKTNTPIVEALGSDSESSSRDVVSEYKKAPWWSYIWVSQKQSGLSLAQTLIIV